MLIRDVEFKKFEDVKAWENKSSVSVFKDAAKAAIEIMKENNVETFSDLSITDRIKLVDLFVNIDEQKWYKQKFPNSILLLWGNELFTFVVDYDVHDYMYEHPNHAYLDDYTEDWRNEKELSISVFNFIIAQADQS